MIIAVGAHSRNVGKTSIICSLLKGIPEAGWTAVKISANRRGHGDGLEAVEESEPGAAHDTARYLASGAKRSLWLRAEDRRMADAAWRVRRLASGGAHVIVESNRIVEHLRPDLYLLALDFGVGDFKDSARRVFTRADAYVTSGVRSETAGWDGVPIERLDLCLVYEIHPPDYRPRGLIREVRSRLGLPIHREEVA